VATSTASAHVDRERIDARLASLRLAPAELRRLSPRAQAPRTPLVGTGRLHGPLDDAAVDGELDDVETDYTLAVASGTATLRAAVAGERLIVDGRAGGATSAASTRPPPRCASACVFSTAPLILDGDCRLPAHQPPTPSLTKKR
jgi:hypothetical protein